MRKIALVVPSLLLALTPFAVPAAQAAQGAPPPAGLSAPASKLTPCHLEGLQEEVRCGTYAVWEDREARRGRKIDLNIVVLPALGPDRAADPIVWLDGGPGAAATLAGVGLAGERELRKRRDVLLIDQRGTGKSNPLQCDFYGDRAAADPRLLAGELFTPEAVRACRQRLEKVANLTLYTTPIAMDDVDEVRAWLGYDKVDLYGGSYGTEAAQVYLRRHPQSVRAMVLDGVVPLDEYVPLSHAYAGKRAVGILFAECAADAACHAAFPRLEEELKTVFERVDRGVKVRIPDPRNGGTVEVTPSRGLIAEGLRFMMYGSTARQVPLAVHQAYEGNLEQLVVLAMQRRAAIDHILAMGMDFSVTCAEDLPYITEADAARRTANTLLGDYRIREQKRVCADWPRGAIPADEHDLVRSNVPALLFSGERDPVTPPEFGERVAKGLPNSLHVVMPHGSHGAEGPCAAGILRQFIEQASVRGLDTTCVAATPPTQFELKEKTVVKVAAAILDGYAGNYDVEGIKVTLVRQGDHLVLRLPGDTDTELFAEADNRFFAKKDDVELELVGGGAEIVAHFGPEVHRGKRIPG